MILPLFVTAIISKYAGLWELMGLLLSFAIFSVSEAKKLGNSEFLPVLVSIPLTASTLYVPREVVFTGMFLTSTSKREGKPLYRILVYTLLSSLFVYYYTSKVTPSWIFANLTASTSLVLIEEVNDNNLAKLIASPTVFLIFHIYRIELGYFDVLMAFSVALFLSYVAIKTKVADITGLLAAIISGVISAMSSLTMFLQLFLFFSVGSAATKYKYELKKKKGVAEPAGGVRGYENVFANTLPALFFALNYKYFGDPAYAVAFSASIASALGDTLASEIGQTSDSAYLITNLRKVRVGENGAVSPLGEFAALLGCLLIAIVSRNPIVLLAGFVGVHVDSLLGATLERKGVLNNSAVNFLSTLAAGYLALLIA